MPTLVDNPSDEDVDNYIKSIMEYLNNLKDKRIGEKLTGRLQYEVTELVMAHVIQLHLTAEQAIFAQGMVEICNVEGEQQR